MVSARVPVIVKNWYFACAGFSFLFGGEQWGAVVTSNVQMSYNKQRRGLKRSTGATNSLIMLVGQIRPSATGITSSDEMRGGEEVQRRAVVELAAE